jgi:hypothetical protein
MKAAQDSSREPQDLKRLRERTTEDTEKTDKENSLSIAAGKILDRASILGIL